MDNKIRLDVCDECRCYLKTYGAEDEENIYLRNWTTLHLDLIAEEKNLRKYGVIPSCAKTCTAEAIAFGTKFAITQLAEERLKEVRMDFPNM